VLTRIDRVQMVVSDAGAAAAGWQALLGAEPDGQDRVAALGARRSRLRLGRGCVELLEPDGPGPVTDAFERRGAHLFAAGAATADVPALAARLRERGVEAQEESGQVFVSPEALGIPGLRMVISAEAAREPVGAVSGFYEVTDLVHDAPAAVSRLASVFGLDAEAFVPIRSKPYGYEGTLTLFHPERLDRLELITPDDASNTMGRFFGRFGETLYMAFCECPDLAALEERAREHGAGHTPVPPPAKRSGEAPHTVFLHPPALGGMMLGLSAPGVAWRWSGRPERARSAS